VKVLMGWLSWLRFLTSAGQYFEIGHNCFLIHHSQLTVQLSSSNFIWCYITYTVIIALISKLWMYESKLGNAHSIRILAYSLCYCL
jgi:hypothetical protein